MLGAYRQHETAIQTQGDATAIHLLPHQIPSKFKKGQHVQINLEPKAKYWVVASLRCDERRGWLYTLSDDRDSRTMPDYPENLVHDIDSRGR
jgi:hypothetical protein